VERPGWVGDDVDVETPSPARIYDYLLGGSHNLAVDRAVAEQIVVAMPDVRAGALANRSFLYRAVRFLAASGIRQFLDLGSGIPTAGNVHEIAQRTVPEARIVYVDSDAVAVAHSRALLAGNPRAGVVQSDVRDIDRIMASPEVARLIDPAEPVGLLMVAILHVIPDADDPAGLVAGLRDRVAPGSHLAIGHGTLDNRPELGARLVEASKLTPTPLTMRSRAEIERFFDGFDLVEPGLVRVPLWHPDEGVDPRAEAELATQYGGVGIKR
jgi:SAM-dependent methyltransferase